MQAGDLLHQLVHGFGGEVAGHLGCRCCRILWLQVQELRASQQMRASASPSTGPSGCGPVASDESRQDWNLSRERQWRWSRLHVSDQSRIVTPLCSWNVDQHTNQGGKHQ